MDAPTRPSATGPAITQPKTRVRRWRIRDVLRSLNGGSGYDGPLSDHFNASCSSTPTPRQAPKVSVATHFGCFQLTDEGIDPPLELAAACERLGVSPDAFQVLETGETRLFDGQGDAFTSNTSSSSRINAGPR